MTKDNFLCSKRKAILIVATILVLIVLGIIAIYFAVGEKSNHFLNGLSWNMDKQAIINYEKACGEEYEGLYMVLDKMCFGRTFDIAYDFTTDGKLSRVMLSSQDKRYAEFDYLFDVLCKEYGAPLAVKDKLLDPWPTKRASWKDGDTEINLIYIGQSDLGNSSLGIIFEKFHNETVSEE